MLEADIFTIYNCTDSLGNQVVTPTIIKPVDVRTILNNIQNIIPKYLSLPGEPNTNIWSS